MPKVVGRHARLQRRGVYRRGDLGRAGADLPDSKLSRNQPAGSNPPLQRASPASNDARIHLNPTTCLLAAPGMSRPGARKRQITSARMGLTIPLPHLLEREAEVLDRYPHTAAVGALIRVFGGRQYTSRGPTEPLHREATCAVRTFSRSRWHTAGTPPWPWADTGTSGGRTGTCGFGWPLATTSGPCRSTSLCCGAGTDRFTGRRVGWTSSGRTCRHSWSRFATSAPTRRPW